MPRAIAAGNLRESRPSGGGGGGLRGSGRPRKRRNRRGGRGRRRGIGARWTGTVYARFEACLTDVRIKLKTDRTWGTSGGFFSARNLRNVIYRIPRR
ncbi:hypothetical protein GWI33_016834 [Rhynchophorus ferrugineus]|uniref:Uncharacterized protein n=1 Tax=Rhynchophorus ferrugineus TaxID=354439 RepID=A0A834M9W6_RHYFE|nr:hypothetical protein GWI33_016834 [Rhynchophorus ferrugineus]